MFPLKTRIRQMGAAALLPIMLFILTACGGGGSSPVAAGSGRLALTVQWPAPSRLVPVGSNSIVAVLKDSSGAAISQQTIVRPVAPPWSTTVTFSGLTAAHVILTATAYPNGDGTGVGQAAGSAPADITPGQVSNVTVTMASTIARMAITPASPTVKMGMAIPLTVTAYDATGSVVLITAGKVTWSSNHTNLAQVDSTGNASGINAGSPVITATDTESGMLATTTLTVTSNAAVHGPILSTMHSSGKFLYVARSISKDVLVYQVGTGGTLTPASVPVVSLSNKYPFGIWTVDNAAGSYLYVLASDSAAQSAVSNTVVFQFTIQSDGSLSAMSPASVPALSTPHGLVGDSNGKYLYDMDEASAIRCYTIGTTGALTQNGADFSLPTYHPSTAGVVNPANTILYLGNYESVVIEAAIQSDGTLVYKNSQGAYIAEGLTLDPSGKHLYMSTDGAISTYSIQANDSIIADGPYTPFSYTSKATAITPDGKYLYGIGTNGPDTVVGQFSIAADGTLTSLSPATVAAGTHTTSVTLSKDGKFVYVTNYKDDTISQFSIGSGGTLTPLSPATVAD